MLSRNSDTHSWALSAEGGFRPGGVLRRVDGCFSCSHLSHRTPLPLAAARGGMVYSNRCPSRPVLKHGPCMFNYVVILYASVY
jgi:hypothetical protein